MASSALPDLTVRVVQPTGTSSALSNVTTTVINPIEGKNSAFTMVNPTIVIAEPTKPIEEKKSTFFGKYCTARNILFALAAIILIAAVAGGIARGRDDKASSTGATKILQLQFNVTDQGITINTITSLRCGIATTTDATLISKILLVSWLESDGTIVTVPSDDPLNSVTDCSASIPSTSLTLVPVQPIAVNITIAAPESSAPTFIDALYGSTTLQAPLLNMLEVDTTGTVISLPSSSPTPTPSTTVSASTTPSTGASATSSETPSNSPSSSPSNSPSNSPLGSPSNSPSGSNTPTPSTSISSTNTGTSTSTGTATSTSTSTSTGTSTSTSTSTTTASNSPSPSHSASVTPSISPSSSVSASASPPPPFAVKLTQFNLGYWNGWREYNLYSTGSRAYFTVTDATVGKELWTTTGTAASTVLVKDIRTGSGSSIPRNFIQLGSTSTVIFTADDGTKGRELWSTDGTAVNTVLLLDINPGSSGSVANNAESFVMYGGKVYFMADDGTHGNEPWVTDGTASGTILLKDIATGSSASNPFEFTGCNSKVFFGATTSAISTELYSTDGTATNTALVTDINNDPTKNGGNSNLAYLACLNNFVYFRASDASTGGTDFELWKSDGTQTTRVADIQSGAGGSNPQFLKTLGSNIYFSCDDGLGAGEELCVTDGTGGGTKVLADIDPTTSSQPRSFFLTDGKILTLAYESNVGKEWFAVDPSSGTSTLIADLRSGSNGINPYEKKFLLHNNFVYFDGFNGAGFELYRVNSTIGELAQKIFPDMTDGAYPHELTVINNKLLFVAQDMAGYELWIEQ